MLSFIDAFYDKKMDDVEKLVAIYDIIGTMNDDEIDEFGYWLYTEFFDDDPKYIFCISDVRRMVVALGAEYYDEILDFLDPDERVIKLRNFTDDGVYYDEHPEDYEEYQDHRAYAGFDESEESDDEMNERRSRIRKRSSANHKKNKIFQAHGGLRTRRNRDLMNPKHQREIRQTKIKRRHEYRQTRPQALSYARSDRAMTKTGFNIRKRYR